MEQKKKHKYCTFRAADRLFGVDILDINEVYNKIEFARIFHAPKPVKGYMNIRGQIYLIMDLRILLGFETKEVDEESRVVIFKSTVSDLFGILVDKVGDVVEVSEGNIEERRHQNSVHSKNERRSFSKEYTGGVCKLENELMIILKAKNILPAIETGKDK